MKFHHIIDIRALEIMDNRGNPTVRAYVTVDNGCTGVADVPSGSSTGSFEAKELRDGGDRYNGKGVRKAVENIRTRIAPALKGMDAACQREIDGRLLELDGTPDKSNLGGNAVLGVSLATARAAAASLGLPLYRYLSSNAHVLPVPQACLVNGGLHAGNSLDIQEYCVMPVGADSFAHGVRMLSEIFKALHGVILDTLGRDATNYSEDGGFAPPLASSFEAMALLEKAVDLAGYKDQVVYALDLAAGGLFDRQKGTYSFEGKTLDTQGMIDVVAKLVAAHPGIVSIEDPLDEADDAGWIDVTREFRDRLVVGDDIFATNPERIRHGIDKGIANAVLCKVNQIGTLTEACDAAFMARANGMPVVMSVRSGETEDAVLSDISVALNAGLFKTGGIQGSDRGTNYNRFIEIEHELGASARYAGHDYAGKGRP